MGTNRALNDWAVLNTRDIHVADKPIYFVTPALVNQTTEQQQWLKQTILYYFSYFLPESAFERSFVELKEHKVITASLIKMFNESSAIPQPKDQCLEQGLPRSFIPPEPGITRRTHSLRGTLTAVTNSQTSTGDKATQENYSWVTTPVQISQPRTSQDSFLAKIPALMLTTIWLNDFPEILMQVIVTERTHMGMLRPWFPAAHLCLWLLQCPVQPHHLHSAPRWKNMLVFKGKGVLGY